MERIILDKIVRVVKARKLLEKELEVRFHFSGKELEILGAPEKEYIAEKVVEAIDFGFPIEIALLIKEEELVLEALNIREYTRRKDFERIRGRIIGKEGKTKKTIGNLTDCFIEVKDNRVAIIGRPENVKGARQAIISLIQGTKHSNVYAYLEHHKPLPENLSEKLESF